MKKLGRRELPRLKEENFEKAARNYKATEGVGCAGFTPRFTGSAGGHPGSTTKAQARGSDSPGSAGGHSGSTTTAQACGSD